MGDHMRSRLFLFLGVVGLVPSSLVPGAACVAMNPGDWTLCKHARYKAHQIGKTVVVVAYGTHARAGYKVELRELAGETRDPRFVTRPHPNPHLKRDDGGGVIFEREDRQAVVELRLARSKRRVIDRRIRERLTRAEKNDDRDHRRNKPAAGAHSGVQYPQRVRVSTIPAVDRALAKWPNGLSRTRAAAEAGIR